MQEVYCSRHVVDRHIRVDAVLIEQVDNINLEALERQFSRRETGQTRAWKTLSNLALVKLSLGPLAVQRIDDTADQIGLKQAFGGERPA
jgi:hypothetical protein